MVLECTSNMTLLQRLMQFVLQCFNASDSRTQYRILHESPNVRVISNTQIAEQASRLQETGNRATQSTNHVESSIIARLAYDSNMKNLDKEIMIFHINNVVRDIAIYKQNLLNHVDGIILAPVNPPRQGKKCLVVDIDLTILGNKYINDPLRDPRRSMRPYLHSFFTKTYKYYDIMIWSASEMRRVKHVMERLEVLSHPDYNVTALIDQAAMATLESQFLRVRCKPLDIIWAKYPDLYNSRNTIIVDDQCRNFLMNPLNGVPIIPYKDARSSSSAADLELASLADYLVSIAASDDLSKVDHQRWKSYKDQ